MESMIYIYYEVRNKRQPSCREKEEVNKRERSLSATRKILVLNGSKRTLENECLLLRHLEDAPRLFPFRAYDTQRYIATVNSHDCITLYHLERIGKEGKKRVSKSERTFSNPSTMGRRKTANCTFKFSFPLLPLLPKLDADKLNKKIVRG